MSGIYNDAERYDEIYGGFAEDLSFYQEVAAESEGPICDLACGTGRVALPLAQAFPDRVIYGVDSSAEQLARLRSRAGEIGRSNVRCLEESIVDVVAPERCGLAICALHSLEHLTEEADVDRFFANLRERVLGRHGLFAFALHLPDPRYLAGGSEQLEEVGRYGEGRTAFTLYETRSYDASTQLLSLRWFLEPSGVGEMESASYLLRLFYPRELRRILSEHRFEILGHWGWYDRSTLTRESGTQVIFSRAPG